MSLRDRLLALFRAPGFAPLREQEIAPRLRLPRAQRGPLAHELRQLLAAGTLVRGKGGRLAPRAPEERAAPKAAQPARHRVPERAVFVPSRRQAATPDTTTVTVPVRPAPAQAGKPRAASPRVKASAEGERRAARTSSPAVPLPAPAPAPRLGAHELVGRIQFRGGGSAFVVRETPAGAKPEPALQVFPEDTGVALPGDRVLAREFPGRKGKRAGEKVGKVVRVLERSRPVVVGELRAARRGFSVTADDPRFGPQIHVGDPAKSGVKPVPRPGDKVAVELGEWKRREDPLTGRITARLGRTFEPSAELGGLFLKYDLAREFPADVEREAAALPTQVPRSAAAGRLDYRQAPVFTIDPDDAKDFDDALSFEELPGGEVKVGIHIADVSTYVHPGTALDREAQRRGNSTYLVGVVVPMLPEKLSNGLCSLVEGEDRLCKAVFLTFSAQGRLRDTAYANTVIRSRKRLTYKQAFAFLFEDDLRRVRELPLPPKHQTGSTGRALRDLPDRELKDLQHWIRGLWKIASRLRRDRMAHGSLDLDMPETKIFVDERGYADRLERIEHDESHQLIEEFMLAANEAVARLTRSRRLASLYRVHDEPDAERLAELRELLATTGIQSGDLTLRREIVRLLETLRVHPQGHTLRTQLLRSLKKAAYRHTPDGHFGLHKQDYTHFTSPIRRYSDLVVHRVLEAHLAAGRGAASPETAGMARLGEHLSLTEANSAEAERESVKIKLLEYFERVLERRPPVRFAAVITDIRPNGFFIELVESMAFGFVAATTLGDDHYGPEDDGSALVGRRTRRRFTLNDRIDVMVSKVDRYERLVDFQLA